MGAPSTLQRAELLRALTAAGVQVDLTAFNTGDNDKILGSLVYGRTEEFGNPLRKIASIGPGFGASFLTGDALETASQMYAFGSAGWQPLNSEPSESDSIQSSSGTWVFVAGLNYGLRSPSGPMWDRIRSEGDNLDARAVATIGRLIVNSRLYGFNGTTWDRVREGATLGSVATDPTDRAAREVGRVRPYGNSLIEVSGELTAPEANSLIAETGAIAAGDYDVYWSCMAADTVAVGKRVRILHTDSANTILHQFGGCPATNSNTGFHNRVSFALNDKIRALTGAAGAASSTYQAYIARRVAG